MTTERTGNQADHQPPKFSRFGMAESGRVYGVFLDADGRERSKFIRTLKPDDFLEGASVRDQFLHLQGFAAGYNAGRTKEKKKRNQLIASLVRDHGYGVVMLADMFGLSRSWTSEILRSEGLDAGDIRAYEHYGSAPKPRMPKVSRRGRPRRR